jgi:hypothetical protein
MPLADIAALLRDPSCDQLDAWARRIEIEAAHRRQALDLARSLLSIEATSFTPVDNERSGKEPMLKLRTVSHTDIGRVRDKNEDAVIGSGYLAAVADGMGGHPGGEVASAVALVQAAFTGRSLDELEAAVRAANRAIWDRAGASAELEGMGHDSLCGWPDRSRKPRGRQRWRQPCLRVAQRVVEATDRRPQRDCPACAARGAERTRGARSSSPRRPHPSARSRTGC